MSNTGPLQHRSTYIPVQITEIDELTRLRAEAAYAEAQADCLDAVASRLKKSKFRADAHVLKLVADDIAAKRNPYTPESAA